MQVAVDNLTKMFGALRANDDISLRFAGGQIHGVLGENGAGKSTLMKLLSGFLRPDTGKIVLAGRAVVFDNPGVALAAGVGMVHQDPLDVPAFTALENLYCGSPRTALPNISAARRTLREYSERLGFTLPPDITTGALTVGQRQQLAIVRLLVGGAQALILDEPTTGITAAQTQALFAALKQLASEGKTVLFVSHKLDEVASLCDSVSVLRAGRLVGSQMTMPQPQAHLLHLMFGEQLTTQETTDHRPPTAGHRPPTADQPDQETTDHSLQPSSLSLRASGQGPGTAEQPQEAAPLPRSAALPLPTWRLERVSVRDGGLLLRELSLELPAGSVTGLAGLDGSGQQLLLSLLAGRLRPTSGRVLLAGADLTGAGARAFGQAGVQYLPADRLEAGVVGGFSLSEHMALLQHGGLLVNRQAAVEQARTAIVEYSIKATPNTPIVALSGGNQQRAMLSLLPAWCSGLLLEQPTRGLDVASAQDVWRKLLARRDAGTALVFASADLDELLTYSDQVLVFFGGQLSPPLPGATLSYERLAGLIGGVGF